MDQLQLLAKIKEKLMQLQSGQPLIRHWKDALQADMAKPNQDPNMINNAQTEPPNIHPPHDYPLGNHLVTHIPVRIGDGEYSPITHHDTPVMRKVFSMLNDNKIVYHPTRGIVANERFVDRGEILMRAEEDNSHLRDLVHFSKTPNLSSVDPKYMGTSGIAGAQYKRGIPDNKYSFFYTKRTNPEPLVQNNSVYKYHAKLPEDFKLYDIGKDPENLVGEQMSQNGGAHNTDMLHGIIKEKGYHGVHGKLPQGNEIVQLYHSIPIHSQEIHSARSE